MIQATLNGPYDKQRHPRVPTTPREIVDDVAQCVEAGATEFHIHARDDGGAETFHPRAVNSLVERIRGAGHDVAIGLSTGSWVEPDLDRRLSFLAQWEGVDYATVNVEEDDAEAVMTVLSNRGVGVDAGVFSIEDVYRLRRWGVGEELLRVSVEPFVSKEPPLSVVEGIHDALDDAAISAPRLQHGDEAWTWILLRDALRRGWSTRIGLEDTVELPDGSTARDNAELVNAAADLRERLRA